MDFGDKDSDDLGKKLGGGIGAWVTAITRRERLSISQEETHNDVRGRLSSPCLSLMMTRLTVANIYYLKHPSDENMNQQLTL
mgnify:CR=1 FL=1